MAKKVAQWGPTVPPRMIAEPWPVPLTQQALQNRLLYCVGNAVECGFTPVHQSPYKVVLERHTAGGNAAQRAGVGFLLFGFIGAAVGAGSTANARVERIRMWVDSHGAVYVKPL